MEHIDLGIPEHSYFMGLLHADGHMSQRNGQSGHLTISLMVSDTGVLEKCAELFQGVYSSVNTYTQSTTFSDSYTYSTLSICNKEFRDELNIAGMPYGKKSGKISRPKDAIEIDYFRGLIDGDGSLGLTARGFPFVSLVTISEPSATEYIEFLCSITGKHKTTSRNKRDRAFNIAVYKEDAQALVDTLYYDGCLCIQRKLDSARRVLEWERPESMAVHATIKPWSDEQDAFVLSHDVQVSMRALGRSKKSIETRLWRLCK